MTASPTDLRARGSRHGGAKLTEDAVREIRRRSFTGRRGGMWIRRDHYWRPVRATLPSGRGRFATARTS